MSFVGISDFDFGQSHSLAEGNAYPSPSFTDQNGVSDFPHSVFPATEKNIKIECVFSKRQTATNIDSNDISGILCPASVPASVPAVADFYFPDIKEDLKEEEKWKSEGQFAAVAGGKSNPVVVECDEDEDEDNDEVSASWWKPEVIVEEKTDDWKYERGAAVVETGQRCDPIVLEDEEPPWMQPDDMEDLFNGCEDDYDDDDVRELWHCDGLVSREVCVLTTKDEPFEILIEDSDPEGASEVPVVPKKMKKPKPIPPTSEMRAKARGNYFTKISSYENYLEDRKKYIENGVLKEQSTRSLLFLHRERLLMKERQVRRSRKCGQGGPRKLSLEAVKCRICEVTLKRKNSAHLFEHGPEYANSCPACLESDMTVPELDAHFRSRHFGDEEIKCDICAAPFYSPKELQIHRVGHSSATMTFACPICHFHFPSKAEMSQHEKADHPKAKKRPKVVVENQSIECEVCGVTLHAKTETQLKLNRDKHVAKHSENRVWQTCKICGRKVDNVKALREHHIRKHTPQNVRPFVCSFHGCNKAFKMASNLSQHRLYHKPPRFECDKCGKKYFWSRYLEAHKKSRRNNCY